MTISFRRAAVLATMLLATGVPALGASTPKPSPTPKITKGLPPPSLPNFPIHTAFVVEVNKLGQVVRVKSGTWSKVPMFNTWTYGNALQMWIRHPDGSAEVGLYKVTYDYDPKTKQVKRIPSLISAGGAWGDQEGAANQMIDLARKEAQEHQKQVQAQDKSLPSLQQIRGESPSPSPSPQPTI
ncbi:MAG TPA: hypothetical protein VMH02_04715 [Verrucomicrobiae bacterium]|nr:hypothetical protein [Verrucomicrobiae bacterium]